MGLGAADAHPSRAHDGIDAERDQPETCGREKRASRGLTCKAEERAIDPDRMVRVGVNSARHEEYADNCEHGATRSDTDPPQRSGAAALRLRALAELEIALEVTKPRANHLDHGDRRPRESDDADTVSYTHLTLPT